MENSKVQSAPRLLWVLLIIGSLASLITILTINSSDKKGNQDLLESFSETENIPKANNQQNAVVNVGKTKTLYKFADYPNGKVTVYVNSITTFYPIGGEIKFKTPSGKIFKYLPGEKKNFYEPEGIYVFWSENSSAYAVEIWQ